MRYDSLGGTTDYLDAFDLNYESVIVNGLWIPTFDLMEVLYLESGIVVGNEYSNNFGYRHS